jgi:hypothetical protein
MMDSEKHQTAVMAITDLIRDEVDSTDRQKFARMQRLCQIAQSLLREGATRAKDFHGLNRGGTIFCTNDDVDEEVGGMPDASSLYRQLFQMLGPFADQSRARSREHGASELNGLLRAKMLMQKDPSQAANLAKLDQRIEELTAQVATKENDNAMVPAQPLRGYPARDEGWNAPDLLGVVTPGADRDDGPLPPSDEDGGPHEAVDDIRSRETLRPVEHGGAVDPP